MKRRKKTFKAIPDTIHIQEQNEDRITCPECKGEGIVYGSYNANTDGRNYFILGACPICSGEGTILKTKK